MVDLNMRVGIHSGRVLCGVLGKKKWQFDVHSNDVKLANHTEQSGTPGRVHITEDTLKALAGRYQVEPANGHLRDTYIAQRNIATYFVMAPPNRRSSLARALAGAQPLPGALASQHPVGAELDQLAELGAELEGGEPEVEIANSDSTSTVAPKQPATVTMTLRAPNMGPPPPAPASGPSQQQQQQQQAANAKLRFRLATQRIINALHFIRTIDAPFANLEAPTSRASHVERMMRETIVSRSGIHDIHRLTLRFKEARMSHLYGRPRRLEQLRSLLLYLSCLLCCLLLLLSATSRTGPGLVEPCSSGNRLHIDAASPFSAANQTEPRTDNPSSATTMRMTPDERADDGRLPIRMQRVDGQAGNRPPRLALVAAFLLVFLLVILVYAHQVEQNKRRDFLWRHKALEDQDRMALMRDCNKFIFFNLLPPHVASYFLEQRLDRSHMDLYHKSYDRIGVLFATISNFSDFYSEVQGNNHGLECLRLLNEIICDFDTILDDERFLAVDKIKTIGSTYMAAIGLFPELELPAGSIESQQGHDNESALSDANERPDDDQADRRARRQEVARYLQILVRFVIEMKARLQDINEHSYNSFKLRVGINLGPVTAGVVGATKPLYDIWGNTVNVASRMETTAETNKIQITEEVYQILSEFNQDAAFKFTCRGSINVKGKGYMTTYYLDY